MFGFRRKPGCSAIGALARAINEWLATVRPTGTFRVAERKERYSGRKVIQVRIFDSSQAEARGSWSGYTTSGCAS
jgi:hypothetical protein